MNRSLNLSLTDELRSFIDAHCGPGTTFSTPSEFVRAVLRERKEREDAAALRAGVLAGYQDLLEGRVVEYEGDLRSLLNKRRSPGQTG